MFEIIFAAIAVSFGVDMTNTDNAAITAYNELGDNQKVERVEAKLSRLNNKLDRTYNRLEVNPQAHILKADMDRKMTKLYKKRAKYVAQLEVAQHEELKEIAVQLPLYNYDNKALKK